MKQTEIMIYTQEGLHVNGPERLYKKYTLGPAAPIKTIDHSKVSNVEVEGVDMKDYPDFCDAFISYAELDGVEMTDEQLESLDSDFVYKSVLESVF